MGLPPLEGRMLREGDPPYPGVPLDLVAVGDDTLEPLEPLEPGAPPDLGPVTPDPGDELLPPDDGPMPPGVPVGLLVSVTISSLLDRADPEPDAERVAVVWLDVGPSGEESLDARPA
jgi:hypothetical protein